jgi:hypothetical protein
MQERVAGALGEGRRARAGRALLGPAQRQPSDGRARFLTAQSTAVVHRNSLIRETFVGTHLWPQPSLGERGRSEPDPKTASLFRAIVPTKRQ